MESLLAAQYITHMSSAQQVALQQTFMCMLQKHITF
jgi:hypothetical protein